MSDDLPVPSRLAVGEEHLVVNKQIREHERVRVRTRVETHDEVVTDYLRSEDVTVERIPIDREVRVAPEVRREGDALIVPVVEEELVVTRRLILKEELHIVRRVRTERFEREYPVRKVTAVVERERTGNVSDQPKEAPHGPHDHSPLRHDASRPASKTDDP